MLSNPLDAPWKAVCGTNSGPFEANGLQGILVKQTSYLSCASEEPRHLLAVLTFAQLTA